MIKKYILCISESPQVCYFTLHPYWEFRNCVTGGQSVSVLDIAVFESTLCVVEKKASDLHLYKVVCHWHSNEINTALANNEP